MEPHQLNATKVAPSAAGHEVRTFELENAAPTATLPGLPAYPANLIPLDRAWLAAIRPALPEDSIDRYAAAFAAAEVERLALAHFGHEGLKEIGVDSAVHRARIMAAAAPVESTWSLPPPTRPEVRICLGFMRISSVDTVSCSAHVAVFIDCYWDDPRIVGAEEPPEDLWRPRVMVRNKIGDAVLEEHAVRIIDPAAGRVMGAIFFEGVVSIDLELHSFPFDSCAVSLFIDQGESEFEHSDAYSIVLARGGGGGGGGGIIDKTTPKQGEKSRVAIFGALPGRDAEVLDFEMRGFSLVTESRYQGGDGVLRDRLFAYCHLDRLASYYIWKVVVPLWCVCVLNWSLFLYDPSELDARVNVCVTMFLATAALLYVVSESLPKTDFLTKLDQLILLTLSVQVLATIETWCVALMAREDWGMRDEAETLDIAACWGIPVIVVVCNLALFGPSAVARCCRGKESLPALYTSGRRGGKDAAQKLYGKFQSC